VFLRARSRQLAILAANHIALASSLEGGAATPFATDIPSLVSNASDSLLMREGVDPGVAKFRSDPQQIQRPNPISGGGRLCPDSGVLASHGMAGGQRR
jgi:hypothetical protein